MFLHASAGFCCWRSSAMSAEILHLLAMEVSRLRSLVAITAAAVLLLLPLCQAGRWSPGLARGNPHLQKAGLQSQRLMKDSPQSLRRVLGDRGLQQQQQQQQQQQGRRSILRAPAGSMDCTWAFLNSSCPDVRGLLAFKAANRDPFGVLDSWAIPCASSLNPGLGGGAQRPAATGQCQLLSDLICQKWNLLTCNAAKRVNKLTIKGGTTPLWGDYEVGQSIPPQFGELEALEHLEVAESYYTDSSFMGGLIGPLPQEISRLTKLSFLNLRYNRLWGQIPDGIGALAGLEYLSLQANNFTGTLPASLGQLTNLTSLDASLNGGVTGSIPAGLGNLQKVSLLSLAGLQLTGDIPDSLSNLTSLSNLDLHYNQLAGPFPAWMGSLRGLANLDLSNNHISGTLPSGLGALSALTNLLVSGNNISGPVPDSAFAGLCNSNKSTLTYMDLSFNQLTGTIPNSLRGCTALLFLSLNNNMLSGAFPNASFFSPLENLSTVQVNANQLSGTVPSDLLSLAKGLIGLSLQDNQLSGPMPLIPCKQLSLAVNFSGNAFTGDLMQVLGSPGLATCNDSVSAAPPSLAVMSLDFSRNRLTGSISSSLLSMPTMSELHLDDNQLSGSLNLAPSFVCAPKLRLLSASGNQLTGSIPSRLGTCTGLLSLDLSRNALAGPIPDQLQILHRSLQNLQLQENWLTGGVPDWIRQLKGLNYLNVSHNQLTDPLTPGIGLLPNLVGLDLSYNRITGSIPASMGNLTVANSISLRRNQLTGPIPLSIAPPHLAKLSYLDLSQNQLSGDIPWGFANLSGEAVAVNFSANNLSGPLPGGDSSTFATTVPNSALEGNPELCGGMDYPPCPEDTAGLSQGAVIGVVVGSVVACLLILAAAWWFIRKRREMTTGTMVVFEKLGFQLTLDELLDATEDFDDKYKIGRGGFGTVYKAVLQDGRTVAIKRLEHESKQGDAEFIAELRTLRTVRHKNLVRLVAVYFAPPPSGERLLVYNYMSGGSLDKILSLGKYMPLDSPFRNWELRWHIALDVARGLKYLHDDCTLHLVHRDIKPANVLLDENLRAYVADFGFTRKFDITRTHKSTCIVGTIGYLAPEYHCLGRLSFKSDVFAFGVLLLQLVTGKDPTDPDVVERGLPRWVKTSCASNVIDSRMKMESNLNQVLGALQLGLLCTAKIPADRPSMAEVVYMLETLEDFTEESSQKSL